MLHKNKRINSPQNKEIPRAIQYNTSLTYGFHPPSPMVGVTKLYPQMTVAGSVVLSSYIWAKCTTKQIHYKGDAVRFPYGCCCH